MTMLERCIEQLTQRGIPFSHSAAAPAPPCLASTIIYVGDQGYGMAVVPACQSVDFAELRRLLELREARPATLQELAGLFPGCEASAVPPFGDWFDMPVLMDETLASLEYLAFPAGALLDVISMAGTDFHEWMNPLVAAFTLNQEAA